MIKRRKNGQFAKGSITPYGFKKGQNIGEKHHNWKGEKPNCWKCKIKLSRHGMQSCRKHPKNETREKMSKARLGKYKGEDHPNWKGKKASYRAVHQWIARELGKPKKCGHCKKDNLNGHQIQWANISRNYKRIISDWIRLCTVCHGKFDKGTRIRKKISHKTI